MMASTVTHAAEVCIVGSGVAGTILATTLARAGKHVVVVEAGERRRLGLLARALELVHRDYRSARLGALHEATYRDADFDNSGDPGYPLQRSALVVSGGSTMAWGGYAYRFQPEDFRLASRTGRAIDWPVDYDELEPYYCAAERTLHVCGNARDVGHPPMSQAFPHAPDAFAERDRAFLDAARSLGWAAMHHSRALAPDRRPFTLELMLNALEREPKATLLHARVARRLVFERAENVGYLELANRTLGLSEQVRAERFIVCGSGIETSTLLLASACSHHPDGPGNRSGHVGRHLVSHPAVVLQDAQSPARGPLEPTAASRQFDSSAEQAAGKFMLFWVPVRGAACHLTAYCEEFPNDRSRVSIGSGLSRFGAPRPAIHYEHDEDQRRRHAAVGETLEAATKSAGLLLRRIAGYVNAHCMCTTRMSASAEDGVVDRHLRVHGIENLFLCGMGCFSSGGAANPTLTIAALAHRLADHLTA